MSPTGNHVDWNDLAALAEEGPGAVDGTILGHLAVCPACLAHWSEAVRSLDGERIAAPDARPAAVGIASIAVPRRRRWGKVAWGTSGLAAAAVLLFLLVPRQPGAPGPGDPRSLVQARLTAMSADGLLLPGVERLVGAGEARYRDGGAATPDLDSLLEPWARRFGADPADSDAAYWLGAAYLASGRLSYADDVLRRALQRHPGAVGLRELDAATAYRLNELDRAEQVLRRLLEDRPADGTARFNLALIESETRRVEQARATLQDLVDDSNPAVQARARDLLALIDG